MNKGIDAEDMKIDPWFLWAVVINAVWVTGLFVLLFGTNLLSGL